MKLTDKTTELLYDIIAKIGDNLPTKGEWYTPDTTTRLALYVLDVILETENYYTPIQLLQIAVAKVTIDAGES